MEFSKEITEEVKLFIENQSKKELTLWNAFFIQEIIIRNFKFNKVCYTDDLIDCYDWFKDLSHEFIMCYIYSTGISHALSTIGAPQSDGSYRYGYQIRKCFRDALI